MYTYRYNFILFQFSFSIGTTYVEVILNMYIVYNNFHFLNDKFNAECFKVL